MVFISFPEISASAGTTVCHADHAIQSIWHRKSAFLTWQIRGVTTLRYAQWCRWGLSQRPAQIHVNQLSQSGLYALRCALKRCQSLHTLHAHWQRHVQTYFLVLCCHCPMNESLVTTIHLQFALPTILDARAAFAPRVANAKLFVSSGEWGVKQYERPVSNTNRNTFGTSSQSSRCEQNVLLVRSKRGNFMPCERPTNVQRRAHNGAAEFSKMNVQGL